MNRLSKVRLRQFEADQKENGTEVALFNYTWLIATDLLREIGASRVRTEVREKPRR